MRKAVRDVYRTRTVQKGHSGFWLVGRHSDKRGGDLACAHHDCDAREVLQRGGAFRWPRCESGCPSLRQVRLQLEREQIRPHRTPAPAAETSAPDRPPNRPTTIKWGWDPIVAIILAASLACTVAVSHYRGCQARAVSVSECFIK
jgi:hypothetical protein